MLIVFLLQDNAIVFVLLNLALTTLDFTSHLSLFGIIKLITCFYDFDLYFETKAGFFFYFFSVQSFKSNFYLISLIFFSSIFFLWKIYSFPFIFIYKRLNYWFSLCIFFLFLHNLTRLLERIKNICYLFY